jgi:probable rRNA maturation factor
MSSPEGSSVTFRRTPADVRPRAVERFARKLEREVAKGRAFDCLITGDAELQRLNRDFRGKDCATDVLSFPSPTAPSRSRLRSGHRAATVRERWIVPPQNSVLGDLAISLPRARAQARYFGHTTETEIRILMLHGLLHLLGLDHERDSGRMARAEKRWRARLGLPNGLIERVQS